MIWREDMNKDVILKKIQGVGATVEQSEEIFNNVSLIIAGRVVEFIKAKLSAVQLKEVEALNHDQVKDYFTKHKDLLPPISQSEVDKIYNDTWELYLKQ